MEILLYGEEGFDKVVLLRAHRFLRPSIPHLLLRLKVSQGQSGFRFELSRGGQIRDHWQADLGGASETISQDRG